MKSRGPSIVGAWALALGACFAGSPAGAAGGDLDPTFAGDGTVTTDFQGGADNALDMAIQDDGKVVAVGVSFPECCVGGASVAVARYLPDGALDPSFSDDGLALLDFAAVADAVAVQGDGRIVISGYKWNASADEYTLVIARLLPDGTVDVSFSGDGKVAADYASFSSDVAIQDDGKIVVAGRDVTDADRDFLVARYQSDGSLDPTFAGDGIVTTDTGASEVTGDMLVDPRGRIVVVGTVYGVGRHLAVVRYRPDGSLDPRFSGDGVAVTRFKGSRGARFSAIKRQSDGRIVVAGGVDRKFALVRYTPRGELDSSFGGDGRVIVAAAPEGGAHDLAIAPDGKIVTAGFRFGTDSGDSGMLVLRHRASGALDETFSGDGIEEIDDFGDVYGTAWAVAYQGSRIVVAGTGESAENMDFGLARFVGGPYASRVTLDYRRRAQAFTGDVTSAGPADCTQQRVVKVFRMRPGNDTRIGRDRTEENGHFQAAATDPRGRFYAVAVRKQVDLEICSRARSEEISP